MLYFYSDSESQAAGPVEMAALHAGLVDGTLPLEALAMEEEGTEWQPLSALLKYYYATGGEVSGPVRLAELTVLTASGDSDLMVMPEGGTEWLTPAAVLRRPNPPLLTARPVYVPAFVPAPVMREALSRALPLSRIFLPAMSESPGGLSHGRRECRRVARLHFLR